LGQLHLAFTVRVVGSLRSRRQKWSGGNTRTHEVHGHSVFNAIALEPNLVANDIDVDKTSMDSFSSRIVTDNHEEITIRRTIENG
jgi:hypothetical protein